MDQRTKTRKLWTCTAEPAPVEVSRYRRSTAHTWPPRATGNRIGCCFRSTSPEHGPLTHCLEFARFADNDGNVSLAFTCTFPTIILRLLQQRQFERHMVLNTPSLVSCLAQPTYTSQQGHLPTFSLGSDTPTEDPGIGKRRLRNYQGAWGPGASLCLVTAAPASHGVVAAR